MAKHSLYCLHVIFGAIIVQLSFTEVRGLECGMRELAIPRISGGNSTVRGEWPFIVALYYIEVMRYLCGGTLISNKHVLTAAHCIQVKDSGQLFVHDDILAILGGYNLLANIEKGAVHKELLEIHVHPQWKVYNEKYDGDIAILVLTESVTFNHFIRPVCLPSDDAVIEEIKGSIVGWGISDNGTVHLEYPKHATTIARNYLHCISLDPYLAFISSSNTFCGTGGDGIPQQGDSGGGFFVLAESSYVQYGVISAIRVNSSGISNTNSIAIYTNVILYKEWIKDVVTKSEGVEGIKDFALSVDPMNRIDLHCNYVNDDIFGYTCRVVDFDIQSDGLVVNSFSGSHILEKTDLDVEHLFFWDGTMLYLPQGIETIFKNLKTIVIGYSLDLKAMRQSDFKNLNNLVSLEIEANEIETFDVDALWHLKNLQKITITQNTIKKVDKKMFEKNEKLTEIKLIEAGIEEFDEKALLFLNNLKIFSIKKNKLKSMGDRTFEGNTQLTDVNLSDNSISYLDRAFLWSLNNLETFEILNNQLYYIDDRFFKKIDFAGNRIETLPKYLFRNTLLLESIDFSRNVIKIIDADFSKIVNIRYVRFYGNICTEGVYYYKSLDNKSLADFQSSIHTNCTSEKN